MSKNYDASNPKDVARAERIAKLKQDQIDVDLKEVLSTPTGRRCIMEILAKCGVFTLSFTGNSQTFFKEGKRSIGTELLVDIDRADDDAWVTMQLEHRANAKRPQEQTGIDQTAPVVEEGDEDD